MISYSWTMEHKARLGKSMTVDEVAELLGWTEAEKAAHLKALDNRPVDNLDEAVARIASRTQ